MLSRYEQGLYHLYIQATLCVGISIGDGSRVPICLVSKVTRLHSTYQGARQKVVIPGSKVPAGE